MRDLSELAAASARRQGFILAGFARIRRLIERETFYRNWLADGRAADMTYLAREPGRRIDPRLIDPRLRSVISLAWPYDAPSPPPVAWPAEMRGRIASYAIGPDYHDVVLAKTRLVAEAIQEIRPDAIARVYVDTGPVFEREWAAEARFGWFGRNTNLINVRRGSYFFLSEIFTDLECDAPETPYRNHCGKCRKCLDLCPTHALADGCLLEPRRCISYLTIENRGPIPVELRPHLGNWIFGCDICQEVCPWNKSAGPYRDELAPSLPELMALDDDGFRRQYRKTAVSRAKRRGLLRNAAVALGNSRNPDAARPLARALDADPEPLVRAHAAWALGRVGTGEAHSALDDSRLREPDASVRAEIEQALEHFGAESYAD